jgi:hypothetical protein
MVKDEYPQAVGGYLTPVLPSWLQLFYDGLQMGNDALPLQIACVKVC